MNRHETPEFVIAALGASAGGLEPLETFFKHMPSDAGIAFVIVQHLAPDHPTALPQLLGRRTGMPVEQAQDHMQVVPNRVYVIPPNATLTIEKGMLGVMTPAEARGSRTPIDGFFKSLAEDCGDHAVCIMLSGTGTDGTLGLRAIKEYGGMAMAQTLDSAKYDAILRSAISTGLVDHVLPVDEMPAKLLDYAAHLISTNGNGAIDSVRAQIAANMGKVYAILRRRAGHDFSEYKESTIERRLERRMKALQIETVQQYVQTLERQPGEADRLFNDLLIGVTQFFRDREAFAALEAEIIPKLFAGKGPGGQVRACVTGCATGEEAYSTAMLLLEHASTLDRAPKIQVFATDIDDGALATARKGRYPASIAEHVTPERLARFFEKQDSAWQVTRELRDTILFSSHSFIKDPPFSRLDLITCRNVMIYLGHELQRKLIPLFHYALRPGGYLFLGPSESASSRAELFATVDQKHRIFQRRETLPRPTVTFPLAEAIWPKQAGVLPPSHGEERELPKRLERIILQRYRPACVAVKENGDAVYFSGRLEDYLEQPTGTPDVNVVNMAREGLRIPLRTALHRAVTARERIVQKQLSVQTNGGLRQVDLTVEPIAEFYAANLYMIVFEDTVSSAPQQAHATVADTDSAETIRHLEHELRCAQEHAQAMLEELESSNEELQSANEEFQSANEELETSREELQSFNEELQTVNTEISRKAAELDHANSDLQNLLDSTEIATIFLDEKLLIRSFTPAAGAVFRLIAGDVGRPITDLTAQFADADLVSDIRETFRTLIGRERQFAGTGGQHYQLRVLPYRTLKNVVGIVLTFTDVTQAKQAGQLIEDAKTYAENFVDTVRAPLVVLDAGLRVKSANAAFYETFHATPAETLNVTFNLLGGRPWNVPELSRLLGEVIPADKKIEDFEVEHEFPAIGRRNLVLDARQILRNTESEPLILLAIEDITVRKRAEEEHRADEARYRALFDLCPIAIYACDASGVIQEFNSRAAELWGRAPAPGDTDERFCGSYKMYRPDGTFMPHDQCPMAEVLAGKIPEARDTEVQIERPEGSWISVIVNIRALKNERGKITGAINCFVDITERKRADEQLRRLNSDLQQFSYAASHDLQEPLRMVTSYTQLLAKEFKGRLDGRADLFIAQAVDGAERMEALLRDLREYWSVNEQKVEKLVPVDCNRVLEEALAYLEMPVRESGAAVTHESLPTVTAEEFPLTLLFQNLIGNAIKYRRKDQPPRIRVSAVRSVGAWTFTVADNGIGIEAEHLEKIFAPFKRLHGREYPGTGLGLAMCEKIVERYRGRIWVESALGSGSAFHFTLPGKGGSD